MRIFLRPLLVSAGALALLAYASWGLYQSPGQVEARVARAVESLVTTAPRLEGCEAPLFGSLRIRRLDLPASPVIEARNLLELEDIRMEDAGSRRAFRFRRDAIADSTRPTVRVRSGLLALERRVSGTAGAETSTWNIAEVLAAPVWMQALEGRHAQVLVEALRIQFVDFGPLADKRHAQFLFKDVEMRHAEPRGLTVEADLAESQRWTGGTVEVTWRPGAGWRARLEVDGLTEVESWLSWAPRRLSTVWDRFQPRGRFDLDVDDVAIGPDGQVELQAALEHYDTSLRLGRTGLFLEHVQGTMHLSAAGARFAPAGPHAEVLGMACDVDGEISPAAASLSLRLRAGPLPLLVAEVGAHTAAPLRELVDLLRPDGTVEGSLSYSYSRERDEGLKVVLRLSGGTLRGLTMVHGLAGTVVWDRVLAGEAGPEAPTAAEQKLVIEAGVLAGVGAVRGEIRFRTEAQGMAFEISDLKVAKRPAGAEGERAEGSIFADGMWLDSEGLSRLRLRWLSLPLELGFLRATEAAGEFTRASAADPGTGSVNLGAVEIPAQVLSPTGEALRFESGEAELGFQGGAHRRLLVKSLRLRGGAASARAQGEISLAGEVALVLLVAAGQDHAELWRLPATSQPADWRRAARGEYRAYRIAGELLRPRARAIGDSDPVFGAPPAPR